MYLNVMELICLINNNFYFEISGLIFDSPLSTPPVELREGKTSNIKSNFQGIIPKKHLKVQKFKLYFIMFSI